MIRWGRGHRVIAAVAVLAMLIGLRSVGTAAPAHHSSFPVGLLDTRNGMPYQFQGLGRILGSIEADSLSIQPGETTFLEPNYPNPVITSTTIAYTLANESSVTLTIHDCFYNKISILVDNQPQTKGRYKKTFDPRGRLASGIYFYTLKTDTETITRRMMLIH